MDYRISLEESPARSIRRIILEAIEDAEGHLDSWTDDPHEAIHETRKRLKEIRGTLRLVRKHLGDQYTPQNVLYRDAGRKLSDLRDATAHIEAIDELKTLDPAETRAEVVAPETLEMLHDCLVERRDRMMEEHGDLADLMDNVRCDLDRGRQSADGLALDDDLGFELFGHGLAKTFRRARRRFTEAYSKRGRLVGDDDHFHEWRKRIKYHRYHARLLEPIWPEVVAAHRDRCKLMTDQLGDDHDLVDLRRVLGRDHHFFRDRLDETAVHDLVRFSQERSRELRLMARSSGRAIFTEKPRALVKRFGGYWAAAQANR